MIDIWNQFIISPSLNISKLFKTAILFDNGQIIIIHEPEMLGLFEMIPLK